MSVTCATRPPVRKRALRTALAAIVCLAIHAGWTAWRIAVFDGTTDRHADAAIVLGLATWNSKPSPAFADRINHGIALHKSGRVSKLVFTGGKMAEEAVSLAEAARDYAISRGVPAQDILVEPVSRTTRENLAYAATVAEREDMETFLIVSDPLHMRRAMRMAHGLGMRAWPSAHITLRSTRTTAFWWNPGRALRAGRSHTRFPIPMARTTTGKSKQRTAQD